MFRTIELPDERFVVENLAPITVKSRALERRADVTLWCPDSVHGKQNVSIIILLHGVYSSHWAWARKGGAHRTAAKMIAAGELPDCILAMPSDGLIGDGSGYVRSAFGNAESWIVHEVPLAVAANVALHKQLLDAQIPHEFTANSGGHDWPYWEKHLADSLRFFAARM